MDDPDTEMMDNLDSSCAWLEGFPVTASLGPAGPLIKQLRSLTTVADVVSKDEIQMLAKNLEALCISLQNQSEMAEPSFTAKCWMTEVRELCYDTKNYLDDAPFISKQDEHDDAQLTPEEKQENAQFEFQMLEARVKHANRRRERYGFDQQQRINKPKFLPSPGRRLLVLFPELIDGDRLDNLANLIWRKDEGEQLTVVSLVGLEGVGKTTFAKRIYHHVQTCGQFQCRAFAKVSRNPDMRRLLTTIFTQIQIQSPPNFSSSSRPPAPAPARCMDAHDLIANIQHHLRHKRYLIIIDDLWSASVWDIIRRAFPDNGCHSRIITTTQFEDVASACCSYQSKYISEIRPLKHGQSQELFFSMFGSESEVGLPKDFGEVSDEIIQKCGGLPLSIVNIASMLPAPSKQHLQEWLDIRDSLPCTMKANPTPEGIKQVLNLIYNNLTPQLKTCLLYLVLYPEGCTISKDDLAKQWVVEGIIEEGQNKEEVAGGYFDELVTRGMIQVVDNYLGVLSCTLHHMVYDLIVKKSVEENFIIVVDYSQPAIGLPPKVRRLSVQFGGARSARIPAGIMVSEVRSLAFFGFCGCTDFIEEYKLVRVLVLHVWDDQGDATFELSGISELLALRYLKIECNTAVKLPVPAQFGDLQHLEVDTPALVIPSDIGGLGRLSSLKIAVRVISREDIRILQKLEALSALSLHVWTAPVEMIVFDKWGFLVLKSFEFRCPVPWLKFEAGSMPCLRNLNLCFNGHEADRHGTATVSIEHLPGLKEITAHFWVSDTDVASTFRTIISNHSSNPIIDEQLVDPIFHGDTTTSAGTIKVEDEKKQAADNRISTFSRLKRTVNLLGSSSFVPVQGPPMGTLQSLVEDFQSLSVSSAPGSLDPGVDVNGLPRPLYGDEEPAKVLEAFPLNCHPRYFRLTTHTIPASQSLVSRWHLPLGAVVHPLAEAPDGEEVPVVNFGSAGVIRCRRCRTYINPYATFADAGRKWRCNLCTLLNDVPGEYFCALDPSGRRFDTDQRPELSKGTVEFVAPTEYMVRPPMPPSYFFLIDVSVSAVRSGLLEVVAKTIKSCLNDLLGFPRTQIGFLTFDSTLHFHNFKSSLSQPQMMVVADLDDVFLPLPDDLLVNLVDSKHVVGSFLDNLPNMFQDNVNVESALGPALKAAFMVMGQIGGKLLVFQSTLPSLGIGRLRLRGDDVRAYGTDKEHLLRIPEDPFYKQMAAEFTKNQIAVDIFSLSDKYCDIASLGSLAKYTGGQVYHYPSFQATTHGEKLKHELSRDLTRETAWESVMRIRCGKGVRFTTYHGHFMLRSTDLLALPAVDSDKAFAMQLSLEETLMTTQTVYFQVALLYTSSSGERRIRVHTAAAPVVTDLGEMYRQADTGAIVSVLARIAVENSLSDKLDSVRQQLQLKLVKSLKEYRNLYVVQHRIGGRLIYPESLRYLPLYILALCKSLALRGGYADVSLDERCAAGFSMMILPARRLLNFIYPSLYRLDEVLTVEPDRIDGSLKRLPLTLQCLDTAGLYLLDDGFTFLVWLGRMLQPELMNDILGVSLSNFPDLSKIQLRECDNNHSRNFMAVLRALRERDSSCYQLPRMVRQGEQPREGFLLLSNLVEDQMAGTSSYMDWILQIHRQTQSS